MIYRYLYGYSMDYGWAEWGKLKYVIPKLFFIILRVSYTIEQIDENFFSGIFRP